MLAVAVALIPLPVAAAEPGSSTQAPNLRASIAKAASHEAAAAARSMAQQSQQTGKTADKSALDTPSFFKTPAGIVTMAVLVAGTGYAVYSWKHDRIHSVMRTGQ
jgi:hypothetical protein